MKSYEANKYVKEKLEEYLENFGIDTNQNFTCINPLHDDKNPSMSLNKNSTFPHCHCFSCGANYDTFDVIKIFENLSSDCDVFQFATGSCRKWVEYEFKKAEAKKQTTLGDF